LGDLVDTRMRPPLKPLETSVAFKCGAGHGQSPDNRVEPSLSGCMEPLFAKMTARENALRFLHARHPASNEGLADLRAAIAKRPIEDICPLQIDWEQVNSDLCGCAQIGPECVV